MEKNVKESEYFVAWLLLWLGGSVGGFLLGAVAGGIVGFVLGSAGVDMGAIKLICGGIGFVLGTALSYVLFRWIVASMIVKKVESRIRDQVTEARSTALGAGLAAVSAPADPGQAQGNDRY